MEQPVTLGKISLHFILKVIFGQINIIYSNRNNFHSLYDMIKSSSDTIKIPTAKTDNIFSESVLNWQQMQYWQSYNLCRLSRTWCMPYELWILFSNIILFFVVWFEHKKNKKYVFFTFPFHALLNSISLVQGYFRSL